MSIVNKKRAPTLSPGSDSDEDKHGENPKARQRQNSEAADPEFGLKSNTCLACDGKDNWVLVCHGEECPLAIHQTCASDEPDFDEFGNFYCPYCWYKRLLVKFMKLQKKLLMTETSRKGKETLGGVVLGLMTENAGGTSVNPIGESNKKHTVIGKSQQVNEERQQQGRFSDKIHETSDACNDNNEVFCAESCEKEVPKIDSRVSHDSELEEGKNRQGSHVVNNQHVKNIETGINKKKVSKDQERKRKRVARDGDGDEFYLAEDEDKQCHVNMRKDDEQENDFRNDEQVERMVSSPMSSDNCNGSNVSSQELALVIYDKAGVEERPMDATFSGKCSGSRKDEQVQRNCLRTYPMSSDNCNESIAASQELALTIHPIANVHDRPIEAQPFCFLSLKKLSFQPESHGHKSNVNGTVPNDHGERKLVLCNDRKRKRQCWTQTEEEMLRIGVQKFPGVRNIPWRKILEFGRDVFHDDRVPSDLKDKWKNMNKMSLETGNG